MIFLQNLVTPLVYLCHLQESAIYMEASETIYIGHMYHIR